MKERYNEMRSNTIKVRVLATLLSLAAVFAFLGLEASHNVSHAAAAKSVTVTFSAGIPKSENNPAQLDMVNEKIKATSNLAEDYYPDIKENEPANAVSFADVLVAAHIKKYGKSFTKSTCTNYLDMQPGDWGTYMIKQFKHEIVGCYYKNDKSTSNVSTATVAGGDRLYAGSYSDWSWLDLYSYFNKASYTTTAGSKLSVTLKADNWGSAVVPKEATICTANKNGKLTSLKAKTNNKGTATVTFNKAGTYYLSATGTVTYKSPYIEELRGNSDSNVTAQIMPPVAVVTVKAKPVKKKASLILARITNVKETSATVTWTKVNDADGYIISTNRCAPEGKKTKLKTVNTIKGNSTLEWTKTGLLKNKTYKWRVIAYKNSNGKKKTLGKSPIVHIITAGGNNYCNPKSVTLDTIKLTLNATKKSAKLNATIVKAFEKKKLLATTHCKRIRWYSNNNDIATVTAGGKVTAKKNGKKGTCKIFAVATNGARNSCEVTVK